MKKLPQINRRDFLTLFGLTSAAAGCPAMASAMQASDPDKQYKTFQATCSMECLHCNLRAYVKDGVIEKIGNANAFDGKPCARGLSRIKWVYAKDRILYPMKRIGERGEAKFERISWNEALDTIAAKIKEAIQKGGSESLLFTSASGNMDSLFNPSQVAFGNYLGGTTRTAGSLCCSAVTATMMPMVGKRYVDTRDTIDQAKYIICWGNNPLVTMQAYWHYYLKAKENGAKIVVIDPRKNETAYRADKWVPIIPGTDSALALGMIRWIAKNNLLDTKFLQEHTGAGYLVGKDGKLLREDPKDPNSYLVLDTKTNKLARHDVPGVVPQLQVKDNPEYKTVLTMVLEQAEPWTPEAVEKTTSVPAATVKELAHDYATSKASMIVNNMGSFQRTEFGSQAVGGQYYLAFLTGNIGKAGTGICDAGGAQQMAKFGAPIPAPLEKPKKVAPIPTAKLGEYVLAGKPNKINFWYTQTCGIVGQWPNANKVIEAVKSVPFFVVAESIMTPTATYADILLPATTVFEYDSVMAGTRNHYVQLIEKAVEPQGEAKPDYVIFGELAKRLGFGDRYIVPVEQMIKNVLKPSGITYEEIKKGPVCPVKGPWIPFKDGKFYTPTGKAHFFCEPWAAKGFLPVVTYRQVKESPVGNPELAKKYPLMAIQRKVIRNIHTSFQNNEWLDELFAKEPTVQMHTKDAQARGIKQGDKVVVYNDRGQHPTVAIVNDDILPGVLCLENGWWMGQNGFNSSSVLTNDTVEVLGTGTSICSTLVDVKKA